ncbi:MAG: PQQ-binding-like beta-propeller repeat protein [Candidatus Dormibacteraeota bacterium]|nr:PQQ-binding-like beta-propeller repeat protein [Candidatus Dormibacteraeota bacterium]
MLAGSAFQRAEKAWESARVDGPVFAAPIVAGGVAIVATECNSVYGFDASTGRPLWSKRLADPMAASSLTCSGNIQPTSGITSTPVADPGSNQLYVVAFQQPGQHVLYALDLRSGRESWHQTVDPPGENVRSEQQRGALKLAGGTVYVPYGGLFGDCGEYHGRVAGVSTAARHQIGFEPPGCPNMCAIWAAGGPTVGADGDLWVATGNSDGSVSSFDGSNAVYRLTPTLQARDWFAPSNWRSLSSEDGDLGSIAPVLLPDGLAWISGKGGTGYLLRQDHLGNVGGAVATGPACESYGAGVASGDSLFLPCWGDPRGVLQVRVDPSGPGFTRGWRSSVQMPGGLIEAFGAVWVIGTDSGTLYALDPQSGGVRYRLSGGSAEHFATPAAAAGKIYAVLDRRLVAVDVR